MSSRFISPFFDAGNGITPSSGAKLFFFELDGVTPRNTYSDEAATTPNANPVVADLNGLFSDIWIVGTYKVILQDSNSVQIWEATPVKEAATGNFDQNLIDDLSQAYEFATVAEYKAFATAFPTGKVVHLLDRGAEFTVIAGTGTANEFSVIQSTSVSQSIDLVFKLPMTPDVLGGISNGAFDNSDVFEFMRDNYQAYHFPATDDSWRITRNFTVHAHQTATGDGEGSLILCDDCWFGASGVEAGMAVEHFLIANIAIFRINSNSANDSAFVLRGDVGASPVFDVFRFKVDNVHVKGCISGTTDISESERIGNGYELASTFLGTIVNPIIQGCQRGLLMTQNTGRSTGVNAVAFLGGEIQQCNDIGYFLDVSNCGFYGMAMEGAKNSGMWLDGDCSGVGFYNIYTESNAAFDFRLSNIGSTVPNVGITFNGITVRSGAETKNHSLILDSVIGVSIDGYYAKGPTAYDVSIIANNGTGSEVQGTYNNVVDPFFNPYRNSPIAPDAQQVGTPLVDNETYGFFALFRNTYEQDFTVIDSGVSATELRSWFIGDLAASRFGTPLKFKAGGSLSSSTNTKNIGVHTNLGLVKNFTTTAASQDWDLEVELLLNPASTDDAILLSKLLIDGEQQVLQRNAISLAGISSIIINGDCVDLAGIKCRYGNYKVER